MATMAGNSPQIPAEGPFLSIAYCHDGTLEGLLSAVFAAYERHQDPQDIASRSSLQPRLGQLVVDIPTNNEHALRVQRGICRTCGTAAFDAIKNASLSDEPHAGTIIYHFVRHAMKTVGGKTRRNVLADITHPLVEPLIQLNRSVQNERHLMMQFLRFEHLEGNVWFARCNPKANVVPLLMDWFSARFNTQPFIIYDEAHEMAGVYEGNEWYLVKTSLLDLPEKSADEHVMQQAWKRFYRTIAIESRYNPELRRQFMPKRLWQNITELQEDLPSRHNSHQARLKDAPELEATRYTPAQSKAGMKLSSAAPPSCQK